MERTVRGNGHQLHLPPPPNGSRPRIAIILTQLGFGGAERQTVELLRLLKSTDWEPSLIVCLSDQLEPYASTVQRLGYRLEVLQRHSSFDLDRLYKLRSLLGRERIQIVHAVHLLASGYTWLSQFGSSGIRAVPSIRCAEVYPGWARKWIYRKMFNDSPRAIANSHSGAEFVCDALGAPRERLAIVPNGVDFKELRRQAEPPILRAMLNLPPETPILGFVGKDTPGKNVPLFLDVAHRVMSCVEGTHAVLLGGGLSEFARDKFYPQLPKERIHFLGTREDLPALVADMSCLLVTSLSEGCPNAVLEALGLGTPVVSTDVGDVERMIVQGENGFVVHSGDAEDLAAAVMDVLESGGEGREGVRMNWSALEKSYSIESMVNRTVELWREIL
ncbi:MAG: glycosyltransferase family 4 protein [Candidatus Eisenbacteria bacterium]|uniref:Glycosyltransferase family 4 protein n=1 Tax=Eiseniibacteriota bacterium TaxID=2212470 RepID=A0A948WEB6_UNCEI|nr:glycosyltransferase family 4 protein [Candidatus Eisenbacteria bacterium]